MRITKETALFFDASVLVAGAGSPEGGSALLIEACRMGGFRAMVSSEVLLEAVANLGELVHRGTFSPEALARHYRFLRDINWEMAVPRPPLAVEETAHPIDSGDVHVLAAALESRCDFLVTLDVRHFKTEELEAADLPFEIVTPGEFIKNYYHQHEDYPELPPRRG